MADDHVQNNLQVMDDLDFTGWKEADWQARGLRGPPHRRRPRGLEGQPVTNGVEEHIDAMEAYVEAATGRQRPPRSSRPPIKFSNGEWTCLVGEFTGGGRMVTVARWVDGSIAEEYILA